MTKSEPLSTAFYLYTMSEHMPSTVRYCIKMTDPVDGDALKSAVDTAFRRYPYLKKSLVEDSKGRYLIDNPRPIAVLETDGKVILNSEQTNFQLVAISYSGQFIYFNNSHAILDGRGRVPVLKTLLYYYCTARYGVEVSVDGVNLADSPIDPAEYAEPLDSVISTDVFPSISPCAVEGEPMGLMSMGLVHSEGRMRKKILKIDEKQFMALCHHSDATPNTGLCLVMCRAIRRVHPDSPKVPVASVAVDLKDTFGTPRTCYPAVWVVNMAYDRQMESLPFEEQSTIFRGKLILDTDKSNMVRLADSFQQFSKAVLAQKDLESKQAFLASALSSAAPGTFSVSYAGKSSYGTCDAYVHGTASEVFVFSPMTMEVTVAGGSFFLTYSQLFEEEVYFNAFLEELDALGVDYAIESDSYIDGPGMNIIKVSDDV